MQNAHILLVEDDSELNISLKDLLEQNGYTCTSFENPVEAEEFFSSSKSVDLLLSDLKLPEYDGIELARKLKDKDDDLRVLIVTAYSSIPTAVKALKLGVDNYLLKPFTMEELLFQVREALKRKKMILENKRYNAGLKALVDEQTVALESKYTELTAARIENIFAIGNIIEARDPYTRGHTERVTLFTIGLAEALGWSEDRIHPLGIGAPLHDIGKIGVPDSILKKEGRLTFLEYEMMKEHSTIGYELVRGTDMEPGALACIINHHERFDGMGYPFGLKGTDISEEGRVMAVCDAFDAMTSNRVYRNAMPVEKALSILDECAGTQFDPDYAGLFRELVVDGAFDDFLKTDNFKEPYRALISQLSAIEVTL